MKAAICRAPGRAQDEQLVAFANGLQKHGIATEYFDAVPPQDIDFVAVWGWTRALRVKNYHSGPILVLERGYIGDRMQWTSLGWDGLNGRARFTKIDDSSRFNANFSQLLKPWTQTSGYALIVGQVIGDAALNGVDIHRWYRETGVALYKHGWDVKFRQHPVEVERGVKPVHVPFAELLSGSLDDALAGAGLVVSFNSNAGVDAVLAGVPAHAQDPGSMIFDLASRDFEVVKPVREPRLFEMAWFQHSIDELRSGAAWAIAKESMEA